MEVIVIEAVSSPLKLLASHILYNAPCSALLATQEVFTHVLNVRHASYQHDMLYLEIPIGAPLQCDQQTVFGFHSKIPCVTHLVETRVTRSQLSSVCKNMPTNLVMS